MSHDAGDGAARPHQIHPSVKGKIKWKFKKNIIGQAADLEPGPVVND